MQTNQTTPNKNTARLKNLIRNHYNQQKQWLTLCTANLYQAFEPNNWKDVLTFSNWSSIRDLYLQNCKIDNSGAGFLGSLPWPNLQNLLIGNNNITAQGIRQLLFMGPTMMTNVNISRVKKIWLDNNRIGSTGVKLLIKADLLLLQGLYLSQCYIGDEGVKHLSKGNWPQLDRLFFNKNRINLDGFSAISIGNWKQLGSIAVSWYSDKTSPITVMGLLNSNWSNHSTLVCFEDSKIEEDIRDILVARFGRN